MKFEKPGDVKKARVAGDIETLSAMGRKGAEKTNKIKAEKRDLEETLDEIDKEKAEQEEWARKVEANEHITPIDPEEDDRIN